MSQVSESSCAGDDGEQAAHDSAPIRLWRHHFVVAGGALRQTRSWRTIREPLYLGASEAAGYQETVAFGCGEQVPFVTLLVKARQFERR